MPSEPAVKRTVAFFDGQNLFHAAREAFGYTHPNYDPLALATQVCQSQGWQLEETRLSEVADEIRVIATEQSRWIKIACAFPSSPTARNRRGINGTDWIRIDRATYDACLDPRDYRPRPSTP